MAAAALAALLACGVLQAAQFDAARYLEHIKFLSSDELKGRGTGTPGLEKAAAYIAGQFRAAGLKPPNGSDYFQRFPVTVNARLGPNNRFEYSLQGKSRALKLQDEFVPFNFSSSGKVSGEVVFAGYGITAPEYNYDDYAGLDVRNKLVLILRHEPQENDEKSPFAGKAYTRHAQFDSKAINAKMHGALGVILINDPAHSDELEKFSNAVAPANPGIPFVQVKAAVAEEWIRAAGRDLKQIYEEIDKDLAPRSFALPASIRVSVSVDVQRDNKTVCNVVAYTPGETPEYIVIGAHYDHLGLGEQFSMAPSMAGTPHPGADDNASGSSAVIELARWFAAQPKQKRGILFVTFAGEELGLLGSSHFVSHPPLPLENAVAMVNMDMIGRIRDRKVHVGGIGTGSTFRKLIEQVKDGHELELDLSDTIGYGSSDHTSFMAKQVPALFFFSGLHADYHKPSDTWEKIEAGEAAKLLALIASLASELMSGAERPQFVRVAPPARSGHHHDAAAGDPGAAPGGYGPYFGSVPDFAEVPNGVRFADVRDGSPAAKAGMRGGDILVEFDGKAVQNLYDFTYLLRGKRPGDEVICKVLRDGRTVEFKVLLEARR